MSEDRLPPHDDKAEAGALACVLTGTAEMLPKLSADDFYDLRHKTILSGLNCLLIDGKPLNTVTLDQWLRDKDRMEAAGGKLYVDALPDQIPNASHFDVYLETIKELTLRRAVVSDAADLHAKAYDSAIPISQLTDAARRMGDAYGIGRKSNGLTIRKPSEFLSMTFDDSDVILGDRLLATGQSLVIAAAGGSGKSRLLTQFAACATTRRQFLAFHTGGHDLSWLILQTENSNRRLNHDLARSKEWLGDDWPRFDELVRIHAIENDTDSFVSLDNPENVRNIEAAIAEVKPDVIAIDPLNEFAIGDLNKDDGMKATLQALSRICRRGNPQRAIIVLHHAITGRSGAAKATGYDRSSFARNSKALHAWARGQINLAPVDGDTNDRLIVACGKCSNGREFLPFGIRLNPETMIYECDPTVDVKEWENHIANNGKNGGPDMTPDRVAELCIPLATKAELAKAIIEDCGCYRGSAYRYIKRAVGKRTIRENKANGTYSRK